MSLWSVIHLAHMLRMDGCNVTTSVQTLAVEYDVGVCLPSRRSIALFWCINGTYTPQMLCMPEYIQVCFLFFFINPYMPLFIFLSSLVGAIEWMWNVCGLSCLLRGVIHVYILISQFHWTNVPFTSCLIFWQMWRSRFCWSLIIPNSCSLSFRLFSTVT